MTLPPSDARRIYLARHGETSLNASGLLRGRLDPDLTERGQRQAEALANALDGVGIDVVVASLLRRAVNTAMAVSRRTGLTVATDDDFVDRDYGEWAGSSLDDVSALGIHRSCAGSGVSIRRHRTSDARTPARRPSRRMRRGAHREP